MRTGRVHQPGVAVASDSGLCSKLCNAGRRIIRFAIRHYRTVVDRAPRIDGLRRIECRDADRETQRGMHGGVLSVGGVARVIAGLYHVRTTAGSAMNNAE